MPAQLKPLDAVDCDAADPKNVHSRAFARRSEVAALSSLAKAALGFRILPVAFQVQANCIQVFQQTLT
jgi:hypothetical protein